MQISLLVVIILFTLRAFAEPVPDTGQSKCYDTTAEMPCPFLGQPFYGQDANYSINPMSYTKLDGSGIALPNSAMNWAMVRDNVTGLIWEMKTNKNGVTNYEDPHDADNYYIWYDSNLATNGGYAGTPGSGTDTEDFINALNKAHFGGYSDWRMPTIKEITSIVNYNIPLPGPTIDTEFFPNTAASWYWSNTPFEINMYYAWGIGFDYGYGYDGYKGSGGYVRAVRGEQPGSFYTDNGDGTVTDISTGLMWQQAGFSKAKTWEQALAYCEDLNLGGYTDWRMPTFKELQSLVDFSRYNPAIDTTYFPDTALSYYWSSTTCTNYLYIAAGVYFDTGSGYDGFTGKDWSYYVRAVRGEKAGSLIVSPSRRIVTKNAGTTTFTVSNSGTGTMPWTATVTSGGGWLSISSGFNGNDSGSIICSFSENTGASVRIATIRVNATGATGSPQDVTVIQRRNPYLFLSHPMGELNLN
jgi:hypothetical protein